MKEEGDDEDDVSAREEELAEAFISLVRIGPHANEETVHELARRVARLIYAVMREPRG